MIPKGTKVRKKGKSSREYVQRKEAYEAAMGEYDVKMQQVQQLQAQQAQVSEQQKMQHRQEQMQLLQQRVSPMHFF